MWWWQWLVGAQTVLPKCAHLPHPALLSSAAHAARLVLVAPDEWAKGTVRVKTLATREEADVPIDQLV